LGLAHFTGYAATFLVSQNTTLWSNLGEFVPNELNQNKTDYLVSTLKGAFGSVPVVGSFLTELIGATVPKQRVDRIADFATKLESKIQSLTESEIRSKLVDENFTDLLEETVVHVARAVTGERREYLANLLSSGLSEERITFIESKRLLKVLAELNDLEIIWLRNHLSSFMHKDAFRETHAKALEPIVLTMQSDQSEIEKHALQKNYLQHLAALNLLTRKLVVDQKTNQPVFDKNTRELKVGSYEITSLGRLLLKQIGLNLESDE
jgi:hypothetical protein